MAKNYYSSVDEAPMGKSETTKKKKSKKKVLSGSIDQRVQTFKMRKQKKKLTFKDETKKPANLGDKGSPQRPANLGDRGFKLKFGDAFRIAKKDGKKVFTWNNKKYTTQTKTELEAGAREKEKFIRKGKSNVEAAKSKKSLREKLTGHKTQKGYEDAKANRKIQKRIESIKKRKNQGKTFSASNLKELEAQLN